MEDLYLEEWSNALCKDRKELDVLAVGAYDNGKLIGIAAALTSRLALEVVALGKVPFYCAAWVELSARETEFVDKMNFK